jgi:hypothetical protein
MKILPNTTCILMNTTSEFADLIEEIYAIVRLNH